MLNKTAAQIKEFESLKFKLRDERTNLDPHKQDLENTLQKFEGEVGPNFYKEVFDYAEKADSFVRACSSKCHASTSTYDRVTSHFVPKKLELQSLRKRLPESLKQLKHLKNLTPQSVCKEFIQQFESLDSELNTCGELLNRSNSLAEQKTFNSIASVGTLYSEATLKLGQIDSLFWKVDKTLTEQLSDRESLSSSYDSTVESIRLTETYVTTNKDVTKKTRDALKNLKKVYSLLVSKVLDNNSLHD